MRISTLVRTEFRRLTATPLAIASLVALGAVPLLYGGLYLWGNADPYGNLDRLPVALVEEDAGAVVDGSRVDYGADVARDAVDGGAFDWHETSAADATAGIRSGEYDFVITIPEDFSADLASASSDSPRQANLVLTTNDTNSYLASTIAEQAARTMRASIAERVGEQAAEQFLVGFDTIRTDLSDAADGAGRLRDGATDAVAGSTGLSDGAASLRDGAAELATGVGTAATGAGSVATGAASARDGAAGVASGARTLAAGLDPLRTGLGTLRDGTTTLPADTASLAAGAQQVATGTQTIDDGVRTVTADVQDLVDDTPAARSAIEQRLTAAGVDSATIAATLADFDTLTADLGGADGLLPRLTTAQGAADRLNAGAQQVATGAGRLATSAPALATGIAQAADGAATADAGADRLATGADQLADGTATLATGAASLRSGVVALDGGADRLSSGAVALADGSAQLRDGLVDLETGAGTLADGLDDGVSAIPATTGTQREAQASTIADPVVVQRDALTEAATYGAGLAPFFIALAAWVGAYALFLVVRPLSRRAITAVRAPVRIALAGLATPALLSLAQMAGLFAIVTVLLRLEVVHPIGMASAMALSGVTFAAIILALNALLGSTGQFLGLILMLVQLVTAGGTFPWQTLPAPLAVLHHALPMTYAVDAMRQVMYGGDLGAAAADAGVLGLWLAGALAATVLVTARITRRRTLRDLQPSLLGA